MSLNPVWEFVQFSSILRCSCVDCTNVESRLLSFIFALIHQSYHLTMHILRYWLHQKINHRNLTHPITKLWFMPQPRCSSAVDTQVQSYSDPQWFTDDWCWMTETRADFLKVQTLLLFQLSDNLCLILTLYRWYLL